MIASARLPLAISVAPAARDAGRFDDGGQVLSADAISQTGKSGSSAATGPCARSVAVIGSAAMRHVSRSFSAISRAVANSAPRPTTNIRPVYVNGIATAPIVCSSVGMNASS